MANDRDRPPNKPKPLDLGSDADRQPNSGKQPARRPTTGQGMPAIGGARPAPAGPKTGPGSIPQVASTAVGGSSGVKELTPFQKQSLSSAFGSTERTRKLANLVGGTGETRLPEEATDTRLDAVALDGAQALPQLCGRDVWKAVQAPVQSREGKRSKALLLNVIHQFGVATNPRYDPDAPDRPRAHIYLWDVTRAMGCEIPHFVGPKELSLSQTVDWIRHEAPMRGWVRSSPEDAIASAQEGKLALAIPRDLKVRMVALVMPVPADHTGKPFCSTAGPRLRGSSLKLNEALGVFQAEYLVHA